MSTWLRRINQVDRAIVDFMARSAIPLLRLSLAITYIWFGALKILDVSPVGDLVAKTVPFRPKKLVVRSIGVWEVVVGVMLLFRMALLLFFWQLCGTFMVLVRQPREAFKDGNPLLLTQTGELAIKNLVLLAAGIAVGSTARRESEHIRDEHGRTSG